MRIFVKIDEMIVQMKSLDRHKHTYANIGCYHDRFFTFTYETKQGSPMYQSVPLAASSE